MRPIRPQPRKPYTTHCSSTRRPRRVLLIGGGVNGGVAEALKHPTVERLDYVELDPALIAMARQFFPTQTAVFASDPRVHLHFVDGRRFLTTTGDKI